MDLSIGRYAVFTGYKGRISADRYTIYEIVGVTEKQLRVKDTQGARREWRKRKDDLIASFATLPEAVDFTQKIAGIRGEHERRITAAKQSAEEAIDKLIASPD